MQTINLSASLRFFLVWVLACTTCGSHAVEYPGIPAAPQLPVKSYVLLDYTTGTRLAEFNPDARAEPASITKIMTSYVAAQELKTGAIALTDVTTVSEKAWRMEGSRMFIEVNKQVSVDELLQGIVIQSGNDASVAMAEYISGDESVFASVMNQHAKRLGLSNTSFANSTGLPDPMTYSSAGDLALLARSFIRDYPEVYARFGQKEYTYAGIRQYNRNRLLWRDASADGFKTGHTEAAGYCLVASAKRGDTRLIAVVMGADSDEARSDASQALLNYGFRFFESRRIYGAGEKITSTKVWKGTQDSIDLGVHDDFDIVFPRGKYDSVVAAAEVREAIQAPITQGQTLGELVVKLDDTVIATTPIIALRDVPAGSIFSRALDEIMLRFE